MSEAAARENDLARLEALVAECRAGGEGQKAALADALTGLGGELAQVGRKEEALAAALEGADLSRQLFAADPATFAVPLASSLSTLSNRLSEMDRDDDGRLVAQESLNLASKVLEADPDQAQARFVLVSALMNQSGRSWRAGQSENALAEMGAAVREFRSGGDALHSLLGVMVDALHRNAMALSEAGCWPQAVAVRRMTEELFVDGGAPAPVYQLLGLTLQQQAFAVSRDGLPGEALPLVEEAAELARELVQVYPDQYRLFLAQSLANLAARQHEAHADAEALESVQEAVEEFQAVAKVDPGSALGPLVATLETFAAILAALGHVDAAKAILEQRDHMTAAMQPVEEGAE